jgi:hypothetical protein
MNLVLLLDDLVSVPAESNGGYANTREVEQVSRPAPDQVSSAVQHKSSPHEQRARSVYGWAAKNTTHQDEPLALFHSQRVIRASFLAFQS